MPFSYVYNTLTRVQCSISLVTVHARILMQPQFYHPLVRNTERQRHQDPHRVKLTNQPTNFPAWEFGPERKEKLVYLDILSSFIGI
jgi:hypothetical protein